MINVPWTVPIIKLEVVRRENLLNSIQKSDISQDW